MSLWRSGYSGQTLKQWSPSEKGWGSNPGPHKVVKVEMGFFHLGLPLNYTVFPTIISKMSFFELLVLNKTDDAK